MVLTIKSAFDKFKSNIIKMRKTTLPSLKRLGLKKDGFLDNAFLGCKMASKSMLFA